MNNEVRNWERWLTLGANLSVFAGLILVAYEIAQSRAQLELTASADGTDNFVQAMQVLAQDDGLSRLLYKAEHSYGELDHFERWKLYKYLDGYMTMSEQDFRVYVDTNDDAIETTFRRDWRQNMALPMYREYWNDRAARYSNAFRNLIDGILGELDGGTSSDDA